MPYVLFLDTMTYLHYRPVEHIDWHAVVQRPKGEEVRILVAGVTLREIDKHKNFTPRLRQRAQRVGAQLAEWIIKGRVEVRDGVFVEGELTPPTLNFAAEGLDPANNDDVLVATAVAYQRSHAGTTVALVTQDGYPAVRAAGFGLATHRLPDSEKLPQEEDALEQENRELKKELQRQQFARPQVKLAFVGGAALVQVPIRAVPALTDKERATALAAAERQVPTPETLQPPVEAPKPPDAASRLPTDLASVLARIEAHNAASERPLQQASRVAFERDLARYSREREAYLAAYLTYLDAERAHAQVVARRFRVALALRNDGTVPAEDIDVTFHIPDGVTIDEVAEFESPEPPKPPARPRRGMQALLTAMDTPSALVTPRMPALWPLLHTPVPGVRGNISSLDIKETGSFTVTCHARQVKHGREELLPPFFLTLAPDAPVRPFQITYTLHIANALDAVTGALTVKLVSA